jgi:outer membrane receptor protein involved in Fe transport
LAVSSLNSTSGFLIYDYHFNRLENKGSGKNYGIELSIERSLNRGYYFLVNTSLYQSKFTAANGKTFNTRFNGNYISNAVGGKEFKVGYQQRNILGINTKLIWTGGQRYTPVNVEESIATGETIYFHDRSFTLKARDYMRMDISISFRWNKPKATHAFFLDLQNLFDYKNINGFVFDTDKSKFHTVYNAGIIPVINYRLEF